MRLTLSPLEISIQVRPNSHVIVSHWHGNILSQLLGGLLGITAMGGHSTASYTRPFDLLYTAIFRFLQDQSFISHLLATNHFVL